MAAKTAAHGYYGSPRIFLKLKKSAKIRNIRADPCPILANLLFLQDNISAAWIWPSDQDGMAYALAASTRLERRFIDQRCSEI